MPKDVQHPPQTRCAEDAKVTAIVHDYMVVAGHAQRLHCWLLARHYHASYIWKTRLSKEACAGGPCSCPSRPRYRRSQRLEGVAGGTLSPDPFKAGMWKDASITLTLAAPHRSPSASQPVDTSAAARLVIGSLLFLRQFLSRWHWLNHTVRHFAGIDAMRHPTGLVLR
jgi:hypothetical protein